MQDGFGHPARGLKWPHYIGSVMRYESEGKYATFSPCAPRGLNYSL